MSEESIPVHVSMQTQVEQAGEHKRIAVSGYGEVVQKTESTYVTFTEELEDIGDVKTIIKIQSGGLTVLRNGAVSMRQVYTKGEETEGSYETPYAKFQTLAKTEDVKVQWYENSDLLGKLTFVYDLELQGQLAGHYEVEIKIKEEKQ
ncbi:DUF1934 domain-containing protein [Geomicrobium sp. JCM 19039]|uniref:DUF1934 domain-containing protein n=1 Tax=Geomicrobium sp. JCM 19039 TaxID=1460636 RepID=UPI00045F1223|nr:DUF1934 domain-containing protein [Geomicrobium sp. JCM 19039]GAK12090.1 hypothetical protein JCM19039_1822 [Geomicrobium sp. JCM 19039]